MEEYPNVRDGKDMQVKGNGPYDRLGVPRHINSGVSRVDVLGVGKIGVVVLNIFSLVCPPLCGCLGPTLTGMFG